MGKAFAKIRKKKYTNLKVQKKQNNVWKCIFLNRERGFFAVILAVAIHAQYQLSYQCMVCV